MKSAVCIVTPDIVGPVKNGGVGTACYWLARFLAEVDEYKVTIIFSAPLEKRQANYWHNDFSKVGIEFISLFNLAQTSSTYRKKEEWFLDRSQKIYDFLKERNFGIVHFQDLQANGFRSIQAKKTGLSFDRTLLTVTAHSSSRWIREGSMQLPCYPIDEAKLDFAEKYCCENADILISPCQYMLDWMKSKKWKLPVTSVIPYLLNIK